MRIKTLIITLVAFFVAIAIGLGVFIFCYSKKEPENPKTEVEKPQESEPEAGSEAEPTPEVEEYWSDYLEDLPEPEENVIKSLRRVNLLCLQKM